MKLKFILYTFSLLAFLFTACKEEFIILPDSNNGEKEESSISVIIDIPESRTRVIDMNPGAAVFLKSIWIGIYDNTSGERVGGTGGEFTDEYTLDNYLASAGSTIIDLVHVGYGSNSISGTNKYCVVGVANYDGVKTVNEKDLYTELESAGTWDAFKNISVDAQTVSISSQSPLLMGYMVKEADNAIVKIDQFKSPKSNIDLNNGNVFLSAKTTAPLGINTSGYVLKLRRLQSKNNIVINGEEGAGEGITITNLEYKVFNKPSSSFLAERVTHSFGTGLAQTFDKSPNSPDVLNRTYFEDDEWIRPQDNYNFSFEHLENKHWAVKGIGSDSQSLEDRYHAREEKNEGGITLKALTNSAENAWNNNATYFILKMNIRDDNKNRNGEVYYTIHEGFINDADGKESSDPEIRLRDFSCVRNTNYTYKITVNGIDDIRVQVETSGSHTYDQKGKIWQINYAKNKVENNEYKYLESEEAKEFGGALDLNPNYIYGEDFSNNDIGVRIVGSIFDYEKFKEYGIDLCYNFSHGELNGFAGLWPEPTNEFTKYCVSSDLYEDAYASFEDFCNGSSINAYYFNQFNDILRIKYNGKSITIKDYLKKIHDGEDHSIEGYDFDGLKYYIKYDETNDNKRAHVRGIYIFDRQKALENGTRVGKDSDNCSFFYEINGAEQIPVYLEEETYDMVFVADKPAEYNSSERYTEFYNNNNGRNSGYGESGMILTENPDIAFRILGFDGNTRNYYDIFYNLGVNEYQSFYDYSASGDDDDDGAWPRRDKNNSVSKFVPRGSLSKGDIPESLLNGLKVIVDDNQAYDLETFIRDFENRSLKLSKNNKLGFEVSQYDKKAPNDKDKYVRALYLLDRKNAFNKPIFLSNDGKSAEFQAYAIRQAPQEVPPTQLALPSKLPNITFNQNIYNIIDPYVGNIILSDEVTNKENKSVLTGDYQYKIKAEGGGSVAYSYVGIKPVNGEYNFDIPMHKTPGITGSYKVIVEAISEEYYDSEESVSIDEYELENPPVWEYDEDNPNDWYYAWKYLNENGGDMYVDSGRDPNINYLKFSGGNFYAQSDHSIRMSSDVGIIGFTIYKPCKITIKANTGGYSENGYVLKLDGNIKDYLDLDPEVSSDQEKSHNIFEEDFNGRDGILVTIVRKAGANVHIKSIKVEPLEDE